MAYIVPVQHKAVAAQPIKFLCHGVGQGRFARGGEAGIPEHHALVMVEGFALFAIDRGRVPDDIIIGFIYGIPVLVSQKALYILFQYIVKYPDNSTVYYTVFRADLSSSGRG